MNESFLFLEPVTVDVGEYADWRRGELATRWRAEYPALFDDMDLELARKRWAAGRHYFEWCAAQWLHLATGYNALIAKYEFPKHVRKHSIVGRLVGQDVITVLRDRELHGSAQAPDLFMFAPDESDYFFCEVKGPRDRLRAAQKTKFSEIARLTGRPVRVFTFLADGRAERSKAP